MATIPQILSVKWPGTDWTVEGDDYSTLVWRSENKPTEAEIRAFSDEVDAHIPRSRMTISAVQARRQLSAMGLRATAENIVADASEEVQDFYKHATEWRRLSPMVNQFAPALGIVSEEEKDAFFTAAALIVN